MADLIHDVKRIKESGLFDETWYESVYPEVAALGIDPIYHYCWLGAKLGRQPNPEFDPKAYLEMYPDVRETGQDPFLHYIKHGHAEGRLTCRPDGFCGHVGLEKSVVLRQGALTSEPGRPTVLLCAHLVGRTLFGSERSFIDMAKALSALEFNVIVTFPSACNEEYLDALVEYTCCQLVFPYPWWGDREGYDEKIVATFTRIILQQQVDVVHVNTIMLREPLAAAQRMGVPSIVHARELVKHDQSLCERIGQPPDTIVSEVLEHADFIFANSAATARFFHKDGATHIVSNTADPDELDLPVRLERAGIRVGIVSSNIEKKGIWDFVKVAAETYKQDDSIVFVLVGPETRETDEIASKLATGEVRANLELAGYRSTPAEAVSELDILLSLSLFTESFGRTVLEGALARRPAIVYDWGAVPEIVLEGETGFIVPYRDIEAVVSRVLELASSPNKIAAMGEAARDAAIRRYGPGVYRESLKQAYHHVLTAKGRDAQRLVLPARMGSRKSQTTVPRVAYFLWHFPVPSETFVLNELRILVGLGVDVRVFCRQSPHKDFSPDFQIEWEQAESPYDLARKLANSGRTVVHSHFVYPTVTEMVWPACELAEIPFTFIAHAQDIFRYRNSDANRIGEIGKSEFCEKVFVPSTFHQRYLVERGVPQHKIAINPNGIDPTLYKDDVGTVRERAKKRRICAIHRFTEKKGLEHLIRAAPLLSKEGIQIDLYGYGELEEHFRQVAAREGIENVHFCGRVNSRQHLVETMRKYDLFVCPSVRALDGDMDGIPTVLMEAMAAGTPVLATPVSGIPDLIKHRVNGFLCQPTPESIAAVVREFYATPNELLNAILDDARQTIERGYNARALTETLLRTWRRETFDVVVVTLNNVVETGEVLRRLFKYTRMPFHLIVCDNGSERAGLAQLCDVYAKHDNVTLILNRENLYVGPGTNVCVDHGSSDFIVYVCGKEGFVLREGWENRMINYMRANPKVGIAGTLGYSPSYLTGAQYPDGISLFCMFRNPWFAETNPKRVFKHVQGGFFILRRAMYKDIGGFSEAVPHEYTDVEYSYYAESCGWSLGNVPGILALYNKTRPGLSERMDESVLAVHPPRLKDLPWVSQVATANRRHCNICGWHGESFIPVGSEMRCPVCGAADEARVLHRYLAESTLLYRRCPALGVDVPVALHAFWREQFQGKLIQTDELQEADKVGRRLDFATNRLELIYAGMAVTRIVHKDWLCAELYRTLKRDGVLVIRADDYDGLPMDTLGSYGFQVARKIRFTSQVYGLTGVVLYEIRKMIAAHD